MNEQQNLDFNPSPGEQQPAQEQAQSEVPSQESAAQDAVEGQAKPAKDPVQRRFDQLTWQKHDADRRANAAAIESQRLAQENAQLRRVYAEIQRRITAPTPEQHNMDAGAYARALETHNQRFYEAQRQQEEQARQQYEQAQQAQRFTHFVETRIAEGVAKYPDYEEVVTSNNLPPLGTMNPVLFQAIMNHEQMPEITYFLGKNPVEAHRIARLPGPMALIELGRITHRLNLSRSSGNAPEPPTTIGGHNQRSSEAPRDNDSIESWMRKRNAQVKAHAAGK
jgi:hypothetical protein